MIEIDKPYYKDNGGVTLSSGEPMMQADFVKNLSYELQKQGISVFRSNHQCVELAKGFK